MIVPQTAMFGKSAEFKGTTGTHDGGCIDKVDYLLCQKVSC